jgi:hypothetical protein
MVAKSKGQVPCPSTFGIAGQFAGRIFATSASEGRNFAPSA